jgi:hypothetical protein
MMSRSHLRAAGFVLVALLAFPRPGNANIIDVIWGMSGPQMFSWFTVDCEFEVKDAKPECRVYDVRIAGNAGSRAERRLWLSLNAAAYTSTGGTTEATKKFAAFENHMFSVEPVLRFSLLNAHRRWRHGVGFTYHHLWGAQFNTFDKIGIKFELLTIPVRGIDFTPLTIRFYPNKFAHEQFGLPGTSDGGKREFTFGSSLAIR